MNILFIDHTIYKENPKAQDMFLKLSKEYTVNVFTSIKSLNNKLKNNDALKLEDISFIIINESQRDDSEDNILKKFSQEKIYSNRNVHKHLDDKTDYDTFYSFENFRKFISDYDKKYHVEDKTVLFQNIVSNLGNIDLYNFFELPEFDFMTEEISNKIDESYINKIIKEDTTKNNAVFAYIVLKNPGLKTLYDFTAFTHAIRNSHFSIE